MTIQLASLCMSSVYYSLDCVALWNMLIRFEDFHTYNIQSTFSQRVLLRITIDTYPLWPSKNFEYKYKPTLYYEISLRPLPLSPIKGKLASYGIRGHALTWIKSFYNKSQTICGIWRVPIWDLQCYFWRPPRICSRPPTLPYLHKRPPRQYVFVNSPFCWWLHNLSWTFLRYVTSTTPVWSRIPLPMGRKWQMRFIRSRCYRRIHREVIVYIFAH